MRTVGYDPAFVSEYSKRPGTYVSRHLPGDTPGEEKMRHLNEVIRLQTELNVISNKKGEGRTFDVLVENFGGRSRE